jgi:hypothetical protein
MDRYRQCKNINMHVYHRNKNLSFILLWSISIILFIGGVHFLIKGMGLIALLIFGLIVIAGNLKLHSLTISENEICIRRYLVFGFIEKRRVIRQDALHSIELWEHGSLDNTTSTDTFLDILFIPALFLAGRKGMTFKAPSSQTETKSWKLYLSDR